MLEAATFKRQLQVSKREQMPSRINGAFSVMTESEVSVLLVLMKALWPESEAHQIASLRLIWILII